MLVLEVRPFFSMLLRVYIEVNGVQFLNCASFNTILCFFSPMDCLGGFISSLDAAIEWLGLISAVFVGESGLGSDCQLGNQSFSVFC
jgi:hypothetical protein